MSKEGRMQPGLVKVEQGIDKAKSIYEPNCYEDHESREPQCNNSHKQRLRFQPRTPALVLAFQPL